MGAYILKNTVPNEILFNFILPQLSFFDALNFFRNTGNIHLRRFSEYKGIWLYYLKKWFFLSAAEKQKIKIVSTMGIVKVARNLFIERQKYIITFYKNNNYLEINYDDPKIQNILKYQEEDLLAYTNMILTGSGDGFDIRLMKLLLDDTNYVSKKEAFQYLKCVLETVCIDLQILLDSQPWKIITTLSKKTLIRYIIQNGLPFIYGIYRFPLEDEKLFFECGLTPTKFNWNCKLNLLQWLLFEKNTPIRTLLLWGVDPLLLHKIRMKADPLLINVPMCTLDSTGDAYLHRILKEDSDIDDVYEIFKTYSKVPIDVNIKNSAGKTPLHIIFNYGFNWDNDLIQKFLYYGADKTIKENDGYTAFDYSLCLI